MPRPCVCGAALGEAWNRDPTLKTTFHRLDLAIVVAVLLAAAAFVWRRLRRAVRS